MDNLIILKHTEDFVKLKLQSAEKGHDWWHIQRVRNLSMQIAEKEGGNKFIIEMAALLHDISDAKFNGGDEEAGARLARFFLQEIEIDAMIIEQIIYIIDNISFKGGLSAETEKPIELQIVQDADRLDAIGAIGIARTFHYGGFKNREIYNPEIKPVQYNNANEYHKSEAPTINHFYEKLLLLKDLMNTETGKKIAEQRHNFMLQFLEQFYKEWNV
jgi:uncharacterized protein